jgi:hypothetical protein
VVTGADSDSSPYVGPRPFAAAERALFFGRDREIGELTSLVISHPTTLLYAVSGAGKSSLLTAGLRPALHEQGFEIPPTMRLQAPFSLPRNVRNVYAFAALSRLVGEGLDPQATLADVLRDRPREEDRYGFPSPRLLCFDQVEELFTLFPDRWKHRAAFVAQIAEACAQDPDLRVLLSLREEYLAEFERFVPDAGRFHLERLRTQAALLAVQGPLVRLGVRFVPGAAESLVHDLQQTRVDLGGGRTVAVVGEFVEPVHLQVVCRTLWSRLGSDVREVTQDDLEALGTVDDSLIEYYDQAIAAAAARADTNERKLRQEVERSFVTSAGTRDTVFVGSEETAKLPAGALTELSDRHVIRTEVRAGGRWMELAHDRLIGPMQRSNARVFARYARRRRILTGLGLMVLVAIVVVVVAYMVSPRSVVTPNVVGLKSAFAAEARLTTAGLTLDPSQKTQVTTDVSPGTVIAQTPAGGESVKRGTAVAILIAVSSNNIAVPEVLGLDLAQAEERLRSAGLVLGTVSPTDHGTGAVVDGQIPAAKERVKQGTPVNLFLAHTTQAPKPDLSVQTAGIDTINDDVVVTVDVRNTSAVRSPPTTVLATNATLGNATVPVPALQPRATKRLQIHLPITPQARGTSVVVTVVVDPRNRVAELDNGNNRDQTRSWPVR